MIAALILAMSSPFMPLDECEGELPQQQMNFCAAQDFRRADAALNAQWKVTAAEMKRRDAEGYGAEDGRPGYFETLLEAQRAWLKYRDAHCRSEGYHFRGGTMEPFMTASCKTALTEARTQDLKDLIEVDG
jgi:uncharacterized protein YecT (DUF1311 family)